HTLVRSATLPSLTAGKNPRWLIKPEAVKKSDVIKDRGCDQQHAIETVEQSAVAWNRCSHVLDPDVALNRRHHQIAELSGHAHDQTQPDQFHRCIDTRTGE